jgi:hypothetical protein
MSSDSLRARSPFFSFDTETGSRRPRWVIFLAGLLAVLIGIGGLVAGVSSASAHDRDYDVSCFGIKVKLTNYNTNNTDKVNTVSIVIDGVEKVPVPTQANFGTNFTYETTWDASVSHSYSIEVHGHDGYDLVVPTTTQQPCAKPTVGLQATECNSTNGVTNLTATASQFAKYQSPKNGYPSFAESYTGTLYQDGAVYKTVANVQTDAGGLFSWPNEPAGHTYVWEVKGTTNTGLSASAEAKVVGCPQNSALVVTVVECTSPTTANASVTVDASLLTVGRSYTAVVKQGATIIAGPIAVVPQPNGTASLSIPVPPSTSGLTVVLTDTASGITATSSVFQTKVCPSDPKTPTVSHEVCTTVGGTLAIGVSLDGLTAGRTYVVEVLPSGGGAAVTTQEIVAAASSQGGLSYTVPPGTYVVRITDKLVPALTKTSDSVDVKACPTQFDVTLTPTECDVAGGKGSIAVTFTGLGVGREYTVTITENGNAVPGYATPATVSLATLPLAPYTDLDPGKTYTVTVVDKAATGVKDAASILLEQCPMTPDLTLDLECLLLEGDSLISATIEDLVDGEEYVVTIEVTAAPAPLAAGGTSAAAGLAVIETQTITGGPTPSAVTFQVPNDVDYTVTVTKVTNSKVTDSATIFAAICDLPTFPFPDPDLPTLALTGAGDTTMPMLGALGLVQFGVALLALAAMLQFVPRRRLG